MFRLFEDGFYVQQKHIRSIELYIVMKIDRSSGQIKEYWRAKYHECHKLHIVAYWRKRNGHPSIAKRGETTYGGELINYFSDQKHQNCICSQ